MRRLNRFHVGLKIQLLMDNLQTSVWISSLVMSEFKTCKNLASWFKTCKILARILQDINQGKKINRGTNVLGNIFEANFCLLSKLQNRIQWKKNSLGFKNLQESCKNLASFWILENLFVCNWWLKLTETQMKWLISVFLISKTELNWLFFEHAFWMWNLARILQVSCKILNSKLDFRQITRDNLRQSNQSF